MHVEDDDDGAGDGGVERDNAGNNDVDRAHKYIACKSAQQAASC